MANVKPYGLNSIVLVGITNAGTVTLEVSRTLKFKERVVSGELKGCDKIVAVAAIGEAVEWELEEGGIPLAAYALMTGRTVTAAGTSPTSTSTLKAGAPHAFPYFKVYGKALGVGIEDVHCKLPKCKLTDGLEGSLANGEFFATSVKGIGVDDGTAIGAFEFVENETAAALPTT